MQIRAITLHQPFASFIAVGLKKYETRTWPIRNLGYIPGLGPIAIHAGKKLDREALANPEIRKLVEAHFGSVGELPLGCVVAVAKIASCERMTEALIHDINPVEQLLGHWGPNRWAWWIKNVKKIRPPFYCRGYQGIWILNVNSGRVRQEIERWENDIGR